VFGWDEDAGHLDGRISFVLLKEKSDVLGVLLGCPDGVVGFWRNGNFLK
jgi:hypothetical protein